MAFRTHDWMTVRARWSPLRRSQVTISLVAAIYFCAVNAVVQAAPVIFRFEATVADGATLPFPVSPGDSITTTFSFESGNIGPIYSQAYVMRFDVLGVLLELPEYQITVANDELRWIDFPGRIADPNNTPDVDFNEVGDNIIASCQTGGTILCGAVPGHSNYVFQLLLVFSDSDAVLDSDDLMANANIWNMFSLREMSLIFRNENTGVTTYVGAYIGAIEVVPEPSTFCLLVFFCLLVVCVVLFRARA